MPPTAEAPNDSDRAELVQRALDAAGKFSSGRSDIGENHDLYFAHAISGHNQRSTA